MANTTSLPLTDERITRIRRFVINLGKTMHEYGTPAHHLERSLIETTHLLGLQGAFMVSPTTMNFVFWLKGTEEEFTHISRVMPSGIDLNRLAQTHDLAGKVISGKLSLEDGITELERIRSAADPYPRWLEFLAWGGTSAAFSILCGTGSNDMIVSLFFGWVVYWFVYLTQKFPRYEESLEPASAFFIALLASGVSALNININLPVVVLSGIIIFIPGLSMTLGLRELAARELVSGTARVMDATMVLFKLYFGAIFGLAVGHQLWGTVSHTAISMPSILVNSIAVLCLSATLLVIFKIRPRDMLWGFLSGIIAYIGAFIGNVYFGTDLGGFVGAMIVGIYANSYSRLNNIPSQVVLLPGVVLLVPGSKVYMALSSVISGQEVLTNATSGAQIFLSFMAIIAGLIFANVVIPPYRRKIFN